MLASAIQASIPARIGDGAAPEKGLAKRDVEVVFQTTWLERLATICPVVIHKDADSDYAVTVPDLPGCFSAGETLDETLAMAKEAIELHQPKRR